MVTLDTNVVLRVVYNDDPAQAARAVQAWQRAAELGGVFLTTTVLTELAWVLRVAAKFSRSAIAEALRVLCDSQDVTVQDEMTIRRALSRYVAGPADFSDYLILESASAAGALPVMTFDRQYALEPDVVLVAQT